MVSSQRNRRSDSGEMSRDRLPLPQDLSLRLSSGSGDTIVSRSSRADFLKNRFHEGLGERDRAEDWCRSVCGEEPSRGPAMAPGAGGAGRGVTNLSLGFMVIKSAFLIEVREALRLRRVR